MEIKIGEKIYSGLTRTLLRKSNFITDKNKKKIIGTIDFVLHKMNIEDIKQLNTGEPKYEFERWAVDDCDAAQWESKYINKCGVDFNFNSFYKYYEDWTIAGEPYEILTSKENNLYVKYGVISDEYSFVGLVFYVGKKKEIDYDDDDVLVVLYELN